MKSEEMQKEIDFNVYWLKKTMRDGDVDRYTQGRLLFLLRALAKDLDCAELISKVYGRTYKLLNGEQIHGYCGSGIRQLVENRIRILINRHRAMHARGGRGAQGKELMFLQVMTDKQRERLVRSLRNEKKHLDLLETRI